MRTIRSTKPLRSCRPAHHAPRRILPHGTAERRPPAAWDVEPYQEPGAAGQFFGAVGVIYLGAVLILAGMAGLMVFGVAWAAVWAWKAGGTWLR